MCLVSTRIDKRSNIPASILRLWAVKMIKFARFRTWYSIGDIELHSNDVQLSQILKVDTKHFKAILTNLGTKIHFALGSRYFHGQTSSRFQALYDMLRQRDLVQKVELRAMSEAAGQDFLSKKKAAPAWWRRSFVGRKMRKICGEAATSIEQKTNVAKKGGSNRSPKCSNGRT